MGLGLLKGFPCGLKGFPGELKGFLPANLVFFLSIKTEFLPWVFALSILDIDFFRFPDNVNFVFFFYMNVSTNKI